MQDIMYVYVTSNFKKDWINIVGGQIWPKFELIQDIMHVLITCKFAKDRINSNGEKVVTSIFYMLKGS